MDGRDGSLPTVDCVAVERPGGQIGPYKLRERIGVGGMGVVWAAEQSHPLRRKVAIKVIKPGMDSEQVLARFEAERKALSLMDHPNIARVLDAGTTEQGRPYFVMELIRGVSITEYCDAHTLTVSERLGLFVDVCKAIQHAHQKGIIHRDIKPSNVLITEQDGYPIVKVIDFGVAKALYHPLTDRTVYTGVFQAIGTLSYMSPEQAASALWTWTREQTCTVWASCSMNCSPVQRPLTAPISSERPSKKLVDSSGSMSLRSPALASRRLVHRRQPYRRCGAPTRRDCAGACGVTWIGSLCGQSRRTARAGIPRRPILQTTCGVICRGSPSRPDRLRASIGWPN